MSLIIVVFAWEAYDKGSEVHLQADPTKLELLYKSFKVKKEDFKEQQKESILEKVILTKMLKKRMFVKEKWLVNDHSIYIWNTMHTKSLLVC